MNDLQRAKIIAEILKQRFGNLTVGEVLDLSIRIISELDKAEKLSEGRDKNEEANRKS